MGKIDWETYRAKEKLQDKGVRSIIETICVLRNRPLPYCDLHPTDQQERISFESYNGSRRIDYLQLTRRAPKISPKNHSHSPWTKKTSSTPRCGLDILHYHTRNTCHHQRPLRGYGTKEENEPRGDWPYVPHKMYWQTLILHVGIRHFSVPRHFAIQYSQPWQAFFNGLVKNDQSLGQWS